MGCSGFFGGVPGFLAGVPGFLGVFLVFWGVPGFSGVPECSVMFRCSGVPCFGVPGSTTCLNQCGLCGRKLDLYSQFRFM